MRCVRAWISTISHATIGLWNIQCQYWICAACCICLSNCLKICILRNFVINLVNRLAQMRMGVRDKMCYKIYINIDARTHCTAFVALVHVWNDRRTSTHTYLHQCTHSCTHSEQSYNHLIQFRPMYTYSLVDIIIMMA